MTLDGLNLSITGGVSYCLSCMLISINTLLTVDILTYTNEKKTPLKYVRVVVSTQSISVLLWKIWWINIDKLITHAVTVDLSLGDIWEIVAKLIMELPLMWLTYSGQQVGLVIKKYGAAQVLDKNSLHGQNYNAKQLQNWITQEFTCVIW